MLRVCFPDSTEIDLNDIPVELSTFNCGRSKWNDARNIVSYDRVVWAINLFKPYKTPGMDGIVPALLRDGSVELAPILCRIYRACIAFGYAPTAWRTTNVIFIPKVGKDNYYETKSFTPISLTSFLLKVIEKLIDRH